MPPINPALRTAARLLPRHMPDFFFLKLSRWFPQPPVRAIAGVTVREVRAGAVRMLVFSPEGPPASRPERVSSLGGGCKNGAYQTSATSPK